MRTPAGKECRYYYEDFHRGRSRQECRLLRARAGRGAWRPGDCGACRVPDILWANASPDLVLDAEIRPGLLGLGRHVAVVATCKRHASEIEDPYVGCQQCAAERGDRMMTFPEDGDA